MNLNVRLVLLFTFFAFSLILPPDSLGQESPFNSLKQKFEEGEIFQAQFRHEAIDSYTNDTTDSAGEIWIAKNKYKIESENQSVIVDGSLSRVYDTNRNRLIISEYEPEEDDFAPSRILNGIDSTYIVETEEEQENQIFIRLKSDDDFAIYQQVDIYLSLELIPRRIRALDTVDNIITTDFENGRFMKSEEKIFTLEYPDSAEVVDLRN